MDHTRHAVVRADVHDLRVEDLLQLVAYHVVDRLQVELARQRLLHAVDQRQLGVPLPRLVHQPGILERNTEAARERLQQLLVGIAERVLAIEVVERDDAGRALACHERDEDDRLRHLAIRDQGTAVLLDNGAEVLVDQQWFLRLEHVFREAALTRASGQAKAARRAR